MDNQPNIPKVTQSKRAPAKKSVLVLILIGIIVIGASYLLLSKEKPSTTPQQSLSPAQQTEVMITNKGFEPATIQVVKGTQVTFINNDTAKHQVASDPHPIHNGLPGFDSEEPLNTNDTYAFTFETLGTFTYHDHLNPFKFHGTVIVK